MKFFLFVISILYLHQTTNASFIYGQPCSPRNTAFLYVMNWRLPDQKDVNCVDITGFKKSLTSSFNISDYSHFLARVNQADTLYADHMRIKRFPALIVRALPNVEVIDLSGNNITKLPLRLYSIAPKITKLLLPENRIRIPKRRALTSSPTLKTLMLSNNGISIIYNDTFSKLPSLEVLYLDSNNIKYIYPRMFRSIKNLKYLHLGQNYLTTIPDKSLMPKTITHYITKSQRTMKRRSVRRRITDRYRSRVKKY